MTATSAEFSNVSCRVGAEEGKALILQKPFAQHVRFNTSAQQ